MATAGAWHGAMPYSLTWSKYYAELVQEFSDF